VLEIRNIHKSFDSQSVLCEVNLSIAQGEFFSLLGPSGCGKSTLLRVLAGLETADRGEILWKGQPLQNLPARERPFNMVFQKYALFPHLSVADNVAFGLKLKKVAGSEIETRVRETLALVNLSSFENRLPETLSGGQAQRVALARALVNRPECILLDEPLTALDQKLRDHMQGELRLLQKRLNLTFIFVTHDQEEAMTLSDRVAVMNEGRVEQVSSPQNLYEAPLSIFCARFIGRRNEMEAQTLDPKWGPDSRAFIRPEKIKLSLRSDSGQLQLSDEFREIHGEIVQKVFRGLQSEILVTLDSAFSPSAFIRVLVSSGFASDEFTVGSSVTMQFSEQDMHVFHSARPEGSVL
jgi:spermidine/putrescine transport system ATP-binding protein